MRRLLAPLPFTIISSLLLLASLYLDPLAVGFVRVEGITSIARVFSFIGDGVVLGPSMVVLLLSGLFIKNNRLKDAGWKGLLGLLIATILLHIIKATFERPRMAHTDTALLELLTSPSIFDLSGKYNSFPSGHTTASFVTAYIVSAFYPATKFILYPLAAGVGFARVYLGSHYPSDIVAGAFLGLAAGYIFMRRKTLFREHSTELLLFFIVMTLAFFKLGSFILFDVDEAVFSEATREMVQTGNYITPTYNYEPRYDKPILFYWLMSMSFRLFGINEFSARFFSAVFGVALVAITYLFVKTVHSKKGALWSSLCLLLNLQFFVYTHSAVTDMTLTFFITASLYSFFIGSSIEERGNRRSGSRRWYYLFWISTALAVLTKGIIGILFPVTIVFLYLLFAGRLRHSRSLVSPAMIIVFLAVSSPWFIAEFYVKGWEFFDAFIVKHHFKRYTDVISSHSGPAYYYLGIIVIGFFPWVAFLPGAVYRAVKGRSLYLFTAVWFFFILLFFSISKTKLPNYILSLFPAMAIITGVHISGFSRKSLNRYAFGFLFGISIIFAVIISILPHAGIKMEITYPDSFFYIFGGLFALIALFAMFHRNNPKISLAGISTVTAFLLIYLATYGIPPVNLHLQKELYVYSKYSIEALDGNGILATYEINQPSIVFYSKRKIEKVESGGLERLNRLVDTHDTLVITKNSRLEDLLTGVPELTVMDRGNTYALLTNMKDRTFNNPAAP